MLFIVIATISIGIYCSFFCRGLVQKISRNKIKQKAFVCAKKTRNFIELSRGVREPSMLQLATQCGTHVHTKLISAQRVKIKIIDCLLLFTVGKQYFRIKMRFWPLFQFHFERFIGGKKSYDFS